MTMTTRLASNLRSGAAFMVLLLPGAVAGGILLSGAALAEDFVIGSGVTQNSTQDLDNPGDTLLIEQGGEIINNSGRGVRMRDNDQVTTNNGLIISSNNSITVETNANNAKIYNNGSMTSTGDDAIETNGDNTLIENSGSITATRSAVYVESTADNTVINNSGSMTSTTDEGIEIEGTNTVVNNSGSITATDGGGILVRDNATGTMINNSGSINATNDEGIEVQGNNTTIYNKGSITSTERGIRVYGSAADTVIYNSGSIVGSDYAILTDSGTTNTTVNLLSGSVIDGRLRFRGTNNNTLNIGPGLNTALTFYNNDGLPDSINVNGVPLADAGNAVLQGNLLAVVDVTGFATTDEVLTDVTRSITGSVEGHLSAQRDCYRDGRVAMGDMSVAPVADLPPVPMTCGTGLWGTVFGGYSDIEETSETSRLEHGFGGLLVGYDIALSASAVGGVFAVFQKGEVTTPNDNFSNEMTSGYGGAYVSSTAGSMFFDLSVTAGVMNNKQDRLVNNNLVAGGLETASADYDGIVFSPSLKVGLNQGMYGSTLTPSVRVRYAGLYLDNYTEKGSAANLAVGDRDVHVVEVRGELALALATREVESGFWHTQLKGGVDGIFNWGDNVNATLLGTDISFAAGDDDSIARGFGGVEAVFTSHGGTQFTSAFEVGYDSAETFSADARLGVNVPF